MRRVTCALAVLLLALSSATGTCEESDRLLIADFNEGELLTLQGGPIGAWYSNEECKTTLTIVAEDAEGKQDGKCLQAKFNNRPAPHYSGIWLKFLPADDDEKWPTFDASQYNAVSFQVKGSTERFGLELKDSRASGGRKLGVAETIVKGVKADKWTKLTVRFADMLKQAGPVDFAKLAELVVVFSDTKSAMEGELHMDSIAFEKLPEKQ